jgi:two-component system, NtrC family, response regulator AtoC
MTNSVVVVEDEESLAGSIRLYLERNGWEVDVCSSAEQALATLEAVRPDVVVTDYLLPGRTGLDLLKEVMAMDPLIKVVMVTGHGDVQLAVEAMKAGAYDYLCKPLVLAELNLLLERALGAARMERTLSFYRDNQARGSGVETLLGNSASIRQMKDTIHQIIEMEARTTDANQPAVLITGETGTGKALAARALHFDGQRRESPFVEVNCASIPPNLLESELFGYERGAFTDAKERKVGLVEAAEGGTLFLDEVAELDLSIQAKLLKLLDERKVRRIGSTRERTLNVRIISATNQDLEKMVDENRFRPDLFFRLRNISLNMPPLREREQDVLLLARHFLALHGRRYGKRGLELSQDAESVLLNHSWPGNVRELQNVLEQAVALTAERTIRSEDIAVYPDAHDSAGTSMRGLQGWSWATSNEGMTLPVLERELVVQMLEKTDWNVSKAAKLLGLSRDMLRTRMEKYGLARPEN